MTPGGLRLMVCDLDDTLVKGSLGVDFAADLRQNGMFAEGAWSGITKTLLLASTGRVGYVEGFQDFAGFCASGIAGVKKMDLSHSAIAFVNRCNGRLDDGERLVTRFNQLGFVTGIITGSPQPVARAANGRFGANFVVGTEVEDRDEIYTGTVKSAPFGHDGKARVLRHLASRLGADLYRSVAFGDSVHDVSMLELVGCAVVIGSKEAMVALARKRGWGVYASISDVLRDSDFWNSLEER